MGTPPKADIMGVGIAQQPFLAQAQKPDIMGGGDHDKPRNRPDIMGGGMLRRPPNQIISGLIFIQGYP